MARRAVICSAGWPVSGSVLRPAGNRNVGAEYYLLIDGRQVGPLALPGLVDAGLTLDTLVWWAGQADWVPAREVRELAAVVDSPPAWAITSDRHAVAAAFRLGLPQDEPGDSEVLRQLVRAEPWLRIPFRIGVLIYAAGFMILLAGCVCFATAI